MGGEGVCGQFQWVCRLAGINLEGESTALEFVENERFVTESKGGIASTWSWDLIPENGGTKIDLVVEYSVPIPVLGKLAEGLVVRQNERDLDTALANIKARMEC